MSRRSRSRKLPTTGFVFTIPRCPTMWSTRLSRFLAPLTRHEWHQCDIVSLSGNVHLFGNHRCRCGSVCPWIMNARGATDA